MMLAHIMGIPVEESVLQLAPAGGAIATLIAIAGRTWLGRLLTRLKAPRMEAPKSLEMGRSSTRRGT